MVRRRNIYINGIKKKYSHVVWYENTGHWPIVPDEVIHHIDGDITNDSFDNLQLMPDSEHKSLHARTQENSVCGRTGKNHSMYGTTKSEETKAKMSAAVMGENNPNWKGDAVSDHGKYQRIWRAKRRAA